MTENDKVVDVVEDAQFTCLHEGCTAKPFKTLRGRQLHTAKVHNVNAVEATPAPVPDTAELFERTGRALYALFNGQIDWSRMAEMAELQKHMLRVIAR